VRRISNTHGDLRHTFGAPAIALGALALVLVAGGCSLSPHAARVVPDTHLSGSRTTTPKRHAGAPAPLRVVSISPTPGSERVGFASDVTVRYSAPLAAGAPMPRLSPAPPGSWSADGPDEVVFHPDGNFVPLATVTLSVPGGDTGVKSARGGALERTVTAKFRVVAASELRLQQLLGELGYLPVSFTPTPTPKPAPVSSVRAHLTSDLRSIHRGAATAASSSPAAASTTATTTTKVTTTTRAKVTTTTRPAPTTTTVPPTTQPPSVGAPGYGTGLSAAPGPGRTSVEEPDVASDIPLTPLPGKFAWRFPNIPSSLSAEWAAGAPNVITTGAVMQFEDANGLATDGQAGPDVWAALLQAVAHRQVDTQPYDYVYVQTGIPEYLSLWRDGAVVFTSLVNTGIPEAPTALGTYPVYARYTVTTMSGTNPDGSHYSDPGIPWVSYFNGGDALHGFLRADYGFPQSLGCVEMPYSSAATLFPFTPLGTLVSIL
jgi:hypothetical protein